MSLFKSLGKIAKSVLRVAAPISQVVFPSITPVLGVAQTLLGGSTAARGAAGVRQQRIGQNQLDVIQRALATGSRTRGLPAAGTQQLTLPQSQVQSLISQFNALPFRRPAGAVAPTALRAPPVLPGAGFGVVRRRVSTVAPRALPPIPRRKPTRVMGGLPMSLAGQAARRAMGALPGVAGGVAAGSFFAPGAPRRRRRGRGFTARDIAQTRKMLKLIKEFQSAIPRPRAARAPAHHHHPR